MEEEIARMDDTVSIGGNGLRVDLSKCLDLSNLLIGVTPRHGASNAPLQLGG